MGFSSKYGGYDDLDDKYARHATKDELARCAYRKEGYDGCQYKNLPRDIRVLNEMKKEYIELLTDAQKYVNSKVFKSVKGAFDRKIPEFGSIQVYAKDLKNIVMATLYITRQIGKNYDTPIYDVISTEQFKEELNRFKALDLDHQRYVNIRLYTGTFDRSEDYHEGFYQSHECDFTDIYMFKDGAIYLPHGHYYIEKLPIDYLSRVLEESIDELNNGYTTRYVPTITSEVYYDIDKYGSDKKRYIKKRVIGAERY